MKTLYKKQFEFALFQIELAPAIALGCAYIYGEVIVFIGPFAFSMDFTMKQKQKTK